MKISKVEKQITKIHELIRIANSAILKVELLLLK